MPVFKPVLARRTAWGIALAAMLVALSGASAFAGQGLSGNLVAQTTSLPFPDTRDVHVVGLDDSERAVMVRAIFNETLATHGYRNDIAAPVTVELLWGGAFTAWRRKQTRFMLEGSAGSNSAPDLGLTLNLGLPKDSDTAGDSYTLGCRVTTDEGIVWTAKANALTTSTNINNITRILARQLVKNFGISAPYLEFSASGP